MSGLDELADAIHMALIERHYAFVEPYGDDPPEMDPTETQLISKYIAQEAESFEHWEEHKDDWIRIGVHIHGFFEFAREITGQ